jgi:hypothetical protein
MLFPQDGTVSFAQGEHIRELFANQCDSAAADKIDKSLIAPLDLTVPIRPDNCVLQGAESDFHFGQGIAELVQLGIQVLTPQRS